MFDRLVIGGGVAGVANALELAAAGARIALVRPGPGASALASGGWSGPLPPRLGAALGDAGLPHDPCPEPLPHPSGELRPYEFAARSHVAAALADARVCGIVGLPGFRPGALARLWGCRDSETVALPGTPAAGWSPPALAARLDRDPQPLAEALRGAARASAAIVLPAVLGLAGRVHARLQEALGVAIIEALGVPPSVPGWRLDRALLAVLERAGIVRIDGRVVGRDVAGSRLRAVHVQTASGMQEVEATEFMLATGRFTGGGVRAQPLPEPVAVARGAALREAVLIESALGCAVWVDHLDQRFTTVQPVALTDPVRASPQPLLEAGVHVDAAGRPLDLHGHVHYENLVAAGSVIAGRRHGLGHAAGTSPGASP